MEHGGLVADQDVERLDRSQAAWGCWCFAFEESFKLLELDHCDFLDLDFEHWDGSVWSWYAVFAEGHLEVVQ